MYLLLLVLFGTALGSTNFDCSSSDSLVCLPKGYNKNEPPSSTRNISIAFYINQIQFNSHEMELNLEILIQWKDERIYKRGDKETKLDIKLYDYIWTPQISALNENSLKVKSTYDILIISNKGSKVMFSRKYEFKIACYMNFDDFPFDKHECPFTMGSYKGKEEYFTTDGIFDNSPRRGLLVNVRDLNEREKVYIDMEGDHSVSGFVVTVERHIIKYIVFYFLPCVLLSLGVWLMILWGNTYHERFLFLTIISAILLYMVDAASKVIPCDSSNFNLLQIWMMIHVCFIVLTFMELKIVHWWYLKSLPKRVNEYSSKKSRIDVGYFILYLILYMILVGGFVCFILFA
ncbi:acetylcholine receptor subunit beta-type lev-1 [Lepeophtheirus salmonis]|uniref:acetylcholine receptor subunit beta-type lev-1 n=1 Tax=Lepeophtheirus salmonis TaxID=72036 RepID=UPI001AE7FC7B|nr:pH-sensitive chloride channel 2-like [Lepeophtheirus salmonis]XP_040582312.1 pH-sensitive chloride channel 2-like [Lepeophtheirus salmonis]